MKRNLNSDHSFEGCTLKRRNSSLFSISTIIENSEINETKKTGSDGHSRQISLTSTALESETDDSEDFFIEDAYSDDSTENGKLPISPITTILKVVPTEDKMTSLEDDVSLEEQLEDCKTGLVFESSSLHFDRHNRFHKERPQRVISVQDALAKAGTSGRCLVQEEDEMSIHESDEINFLNDEDYLRVHLPGYMKRLTKFSTCACNDKLDFEAQQFKSIYLTSDTVQQAKDAASSLCRLVTKVVRSNQDLDNGFAIIRPPGHHAEPGFTGGYCIINNVAVAAAYARKVLGLKKILIVDWDVHHGNGTQSIFINDPDVLFFSVHRWHGGNFFPFLQNGGPTTIGNGKGAGFNVNVGWSRKGMGDREYFALWEALLLPLAREFEPELILVSAGFDAADGDMGECHVTPSGFRRLTQGLKTLNSKIVCSLEGGYVRSVLGNCVTEVVEALLDRTSPQQYSNEVAAERRERGTGVDILDTIDSNAAKNIRATISAQKPYWKCCQ